MPFRLLSWSRRKLSNNSGMVTGETICVAETYTVNSLPRHLMAIPNRNNNATDLASVKGWLRPALSPRFALERKYQPHDYDST